MLRGSRGPGLRPRNTALITELSPLPVLHENPAPPNATTGASLDELPGTGLSALLADRAPAFRAEGESWPFRGCRAQAGRRRLQDCRCPAGVPGGGTSGSAGASGGSCRRREWAVYIVMVGPRAPAAAAPGGA